MPRGGARPGAGRPRKQPAEAPAKKRASAKSTNVPAVDADGYKTDPNWPFGQERPEDLSGLMPLDYLLQVMRDPNEDRGRRMQAATLAAPYCHPKKGESGKKEQKADAAKKVAGRFTAAAPPKLVVAGGKKV